MKKNCFLFVLLCVCYLSACQDKTQPDARTDLNELEQEYPEEETSKTDSENTADSDSENTENSDSEDTGSTEGEIAEVIQPVSTVGADVTSGNSYIYDGSPIEITHVYTADGNVSSYGLMVLCDGILVPFAVDKGGEERKLQIIPYTSESGEPVTTTLYITPSGKKDSQTSIEIVDIVEPDYDISTLEFDSEDDSEDFSEVMSALVHGRRYCAYSLAGIMVSMEADGTLEKASVSEKYETEDIPKKVIESNLTVKDDGTVDNQLSYFSAEAADGSLVRRVKKGDILPLDATLHGTNGQDICISFFLDNELTPVFDSCDYVRCRVDSEHYTKVHGELDTKNLEPGRYICYTVCGNIEHLMNSSPIPPFILEVN